MKRLALHQSHQDMGATFFEYGGWEVPLSYGPVQEEYWAARKGLGIADLTYNGRIAVLGNNRTDFMNNLATNDIKSLQANHGCRALFLNNIGRILADCRIYNLNNRLLVDLDAGAHEKICGMLQGMAGLAGCSVISLQNFYGCVSLLGPKASDIALELLADGLKENEACEKTLAGYPVTVINNPLPVPRFDILLPAAGLKALWDALMAAGSKYDMKPVGWEALNVLRMEGGIPVYGADYDESTMALEVPCFEKAISFTKGCFTGQEIVGRVHSRGARVPKKLAGLWVEGETLPKNGDDIMKNNSIIGRITSAVYSYGLKKNIALGYVSKESYDPGNTVTIRCGSGAADGRVAELPFCRKA
ncbi:MAG: aminomethyl transferase family protein [Candidatus Aenigmarchaeota archaeon]|nr:aminomethyl transferase family protein [Candidatus Aenigmarchaeota archaeon]